jgi:hypothetical protein
LGIAASTIVASTILLFAIGASIDGPIFESPLYRLGGWGWLLFDLDLFSLLALPFLVFLGVLASLVGIGRSGRRGQGRKAVAGLVLSIGAITALVVAVYVVVSSG